MPILAPADKIVDLLHQHQAFLLPRSEFLRTSTTVSTNLTTSGPTPLSYFSHMTAHSARLHTTFCRLYNNNQECCTVCF